MIGTSLSCVVWLNLNLLYDLVELVLQSPYFLDYQRGNGNANLPGNDKQNTSNDKFQQGDAHGFTTSLCYIPLTGRIEEAAPHEADRAFCLGVELRLPR
jgi:hypothetical protein